MKASKKRRNALRTDPITEFRQIIRDPALGSMEVAQDILEENGLTLTDVSEKLEVDIPPDLSNEISMSRLDGWEWIDRVSNSPGRGYFDLTPEHRLDKGAHVGVAWTIQQRTSDDAQLGWLHIVWGRVTWIEAQHGIKLFTGSGDIRKSEDPALFAAPFGFPVPFGQGSRPMLVRAAWRVAKVLHRFVGEATAFAGGAYRQRIEDERARDIMYAIRTEFLGGGDPSIADAIVPMNDPRGRRPNPANPPRGRDALTRSLVVARVRELLLDTDPSAGVIETISDTLIEQGMTLTEVSQDLALSVSTGAVNHRMGVFPITEPVETAFVGRFSAPTTEGVAWYVSPSSVEGRFYGFVVVYARGLELQSPGNIGRHYHKSIDDATEATVRLAWRLTVALKMAREVSDEEEIKTLVEHPPEIAIPAELLHVQQVGPGDLKPNPPWVTHTLADAFESLESQVPAQWLPKLDDVRGGARGTMVAKMTEYGCGAYGCVLPTLDPAVVLKVTTDSTEAEFAVKLAADLVAPVCVDYSMAVSLAAKHEGRPIYLLWRESADDVGDIDKILGPKAEAAITLQHKAAQAAYLALRRKTDSKALLLEWVYACEAMGDDVPELRHLADGLVKIFREQKIFFGDIHGGNLGRVFRGDEVGQWVITDPGHVAVLG